MCIRNDGMYIDTIIYIQETISKWGTVDDCNIHLPIVKSLLVKDVTKNSAKVLFCFVLFCFVCLFACLFGWLQYLSV